MRTRLASHSGEGRAPQPGRATQSHSSHSKEGLRLTQPEQETLCLVAATSAEQGSLTAAAACTQVWRDVGVPASTSLMAEAQDEQPILSEAKSSCKCTSGAPVPPSPATQEPPAAEALTMAQLASFFSALLSDHLALSIKEKIWKVFGGKTDSTSREP